MASLFAVSAVRNNGRTLIRSSNYMMNLNRRASSRSPRNLSAADRHSVMEYVDNWPGSKLGWSSFYTGKGMEQYPEIRKQFMDLNKTMLKSLWNEIPTLSQRMRYFTKLSSNIIKTSFLDRDIKAKLDENVSSKLKGVAIEYKFVNGVIPAIMVSKTLNEMFDEETCDQIMCKVHNKMNAVYNEVHFQYLEQIPHHLRYAAVNEFWKRVMNKSVNEEGIFDLKWVNDDVFSDHFEMHVQRCAFCDISKSVGNQRWVYQSVCKLDDVFLPDWGQKADFKYQRKGTLSTGCTHCDFKFSRD